MLQNPHPWAAELTTLYDQVWARLVRGVNDRRAPTRHPTLATVCPEGMPRVRTVVLRAANPKAHYLDIHTDSHAAKVHDLRHMPYAALHIWDETARLQMRIDCRAQFLSSADNALEWERVSPQARVSYGVTPNPGAPIDDALAYNREPSPAAFSVIRFAVSAFDILHLGHHHRRARFDEIGGWQGQWLVP